MENDNYLHNLRGMLLFEILRYDERQISMGGLMIR